MNKVFKIFLFLVLVMVPIAVFGQGSGSTAPKKKSKPKTTRKAKNNFAVKKTVNGVITSLSRTRIVVRRSNGKRISLRYNSKTRRARACFKRGHRVRATYSGKRRYVSRITCLRKKRKR